MTAIPNLTRVLPGDPAARLALKLFLVAGLTLALVSIPAFVLGWKWESEKHFLKSYRVPDWAEAHVEIQMNYALTKHDANDVIFVGDSTTIVAVQPLLFERQTGLVGYNLALPGIVGIDGYLRLIEIYLDNHPVPRLLVYGAHPLDYGHTAPGWQDIRDRFGWSYGVWSGGQAADPSFSLPYYVREGIRIAAGELNGGRSHYFEKQFRDWNAAVFKQRGFFEKPGVLPDEAKFLPNPYETFVVSPWYAKHLHAIARLTSNRGIRLMIMPTPVMARDRQEDAGRLFAWLRTIQDEYPNVRVGASSMLLYDVSEFGEAVHVNIAGAGRFTTQLSEQVKMFYPDLMKSVTSGASR